MRRASLPKAALIALAVAAAAAGMAYLLLGEAYAARARRLEAAGDFAAAAARYRKAVSIFRLFGKEAEEEETLLALASCYSALDRNLLAARAAAEACAMARARVKRGEEKPAALADRLALLAYYRYRADMTEDAWEALSEARELDADNPRTAYVQGLLLMQAGDFAMALKTLDRAVELGRKRKDRFLGNYHLARAEVLVRLERYGEAKEDAARAISAGLSGLEARLVYIKCCIYTGDLKEGRRAAVEAEDKFPDFPVFRCYLATLDMLDGKYEAAKARFEEVLSLGGPEGEDVTFSLGVACFCLGSYDEARRHFMAARETDPVLVTVLLYLCAMKGGSEKEAEHLLDSPPFALASPRLTFYRGILRGEYERERLLALMELRKAAPSPPDEERKALEKLGVPLRPPLSGLPWEEIGFVCGEAALLQKADEDAARFFTAAVDSDHRFYWTYILSLHELRRLGKR